MIQNTSTNCNSHCQVLAGSDLFLVSWRCWQKSGEIDKALLLKLYALIILNWNFTGTMYWGYRKNIIVLEKLAGISNARKCKEVQCEFPSCGQMLVVVSEQSSTGISTLLAPGYVGLGWVFLCPGFLSWGWLAWTQPARRLHKTISDSPRMPASVCSKMSACAWANFCLLG